MVVMDDDTDDDDDDDDDDNDSPVESMQVDDKEASDNVKEA